MSDVCDTEVLSCPARDEVLSNADHLQLLLERLHIEHGRTLHVRAASRTCHSWRDTIEAIIEQQRPFLTPQRLEKEASDADFKRLFKWSKDVAALPDGGVAVLGQSTSQTFVFIYDAANQPRSVVELSGRIGTMEDDQGGSPTSSLHLAVAGTTIYIVSAYKAWGYFVSMFEFDLETGARLAKADLNDIVPPTYDTPYYSHRIYSHPFCMLSAEGCIYLSFLKSILCMRLGRNLPMETRWKQFVRPAAFSTTDDDPFMGFVQLAVHENELFVLDATLKGSPCVRILVFNISTGEVVRSFGHYGVAEKKSRRCVDPKCFGLHARIAIVSGRLVVTEDLQLGNSTWETIPRVRVLTLTGEPLYVLTMDSPLLSPSRSLHPSRRFPIGIRKSQNAVWPIGELGRVTEGFCAGRGASAGRLFVAGGKQSSGYVWSLDVRGED